MRPRSKNPKRNTVSVRFDDDTIAEVEAAAGKERISPWIRDAAIEKARGLAVGVALPTEPDIVEGEKGHA